MAATRKAGPRTRVATFPLGEIGTLYTIASFAEVEASLQQALLNQTACNLNCPNVNFKPNLKLNFTSISASKYIIINSQPQFNPKRQPPRRPTPMSNSSPFSYLSPGSANATMHHYKTQHAQVVNAAMVFANCGHTRSFLDWTDKVPMLARALHDARLVPRIRKGKKNYVGLWFARALLGTAPVQVWSLGTSMV